ncbi:MULTISPECIES: hypothetical protein [Nocardia]|uniref:hypothetical protein n=1 Tax=Nocardia TaxID=1817 RepID=UPI0007E9BBA8|nr:MULTISPECIES: hypothetical protein [Nocardia]MBF6278561.1 hypothetical protein [Nocardia nova]OBA53661.1 hypothetical protein A5789_23485 [Nocardia sp. 852002-51101_SCH5132738]OBB34793.1 hypothetical protein A5748_06235 [Nocardia sp. 852002-51244_SCH5132740]OBF80971.1 hypothetical protein A9X06_20350 [Mycobacterium sp. 852002-51759_SCH5129042]
MERADQQLSWNRDDQAFFAAGACHILAYAFLEIHTRGWNPIGLWPSSADNPSHVYASDGTWAFDHCGWTPEPELLLASRAAEPHADYQRRPILMGLDEFCARHYHRTRTEFACDPWPRAHDYISRFADCRFRLKTGSGTDFVIDRFGMRRGG